jgi:hypothetical protein
MPTGRSRPFFECLTDFLDTNHRMTDRRSIP